MKITAIQQALQTLGFLPATHCLGGEWDSQTNAGYIQAAQASNLQPALWAQPSHPDQLPSPVYSLIYGSNGDNGEALVDDDGEPTAAAIAAASAAAAKEETDRAEAQQLANAKAAADEASALKIANMEQEVAADAKELETDSDTNAPDAEGEHVTRFD